MCQNAHMVYSSKCYYGQETVSIQFFTLFYAVYCYCLYPIKIYK